jgi:hypothetical protein
MKRNIFPASIFILVLITILSSTSDFSFAEDEHSLESHQNEAEKTSVSEDIEEEHDSSHENETSMDELDDQLEHEHMDVTTEGPHVHNSITAEAAQWIGVGTLLVAAPVFAIRMRSANKLRFKDVVVTLAIGIGIMHVLLAPDHLIDVGIEHGIFFAIAGSAQIGFGLLFISNPTRGLAIIGTAGTIGSIFLYFITRMLELPEPFGAPEGIDQVGIIAKVAEISLVAILIYLIVYLRKQMPVGIAKETKNN